MKKTLFSAMALGALIANNLKAQITAPQIYTPSGTTVLATTNNTSTAPSSNVGIGTATPTAKLDVNGTIKSNSTVTGAKFIANGFSQFTGGYGDRFEVGGGGQGGGGTTIFWEQGLKMSTFGVAARLGSFSNVTGFSGAALVGDYIASGSSTYTGSSDLGVFAGAGRDLYLGGGKSIHMKIASSGKVTLSDPGVTLNVGNALPSSFRLFVQDGILTEKLKVSPKNTADWSWPDYVFSKSYKLNSLDSVETFINKNSHLPDVPSAKEIGTNGFDVAEMDAKLLRKVEELTLYVIDMNKKLNEQEKEKTQTKEEVAVLKKKIEALEVENNELKK